MKKLTILFATVCLLLAGCATAEPTTSSTTQHSTPPTSTITGVPQTQPSSTVNTESTAPQGPITITLYLPNEALDGFVEKEVAIDSLQPELIIQHLAEQGAVNMDVRVLSAVKEGSQLSLDMNEAFLMQVSSMGTTGEKMLIGSLVNTFLSAYDCETLILTAEGQIIHSGHVDYDFPLGPFT